MSFKTLDRYLSGLNPVNKILNTLVGCAVLTTSLTLGSLFIKSVKIRYELVKAEPYFDNWIEPREILKYYDQHHLVIPEKIRLFCTEFISEEKPLVEKDLISSQEILPNLPVEIYRKFELEKKLKMTSEDYEPVVLMEVWTNRPSTSERSHFAKELISYAEQKLTEREYYHLILAYLYARRLLNILKVINVGNLNARHLKIYIRPTPTLTSGMKGSIISIKPLFPLNYNIEDYQAIIHIPYLKTNHQNKIHIATREANLFNWNISIDYETERTINFTAVLYVFLVSFTVASIIAFIFGRSNSKRND